MLLSKLLNESEIVQGWKYLCSTHEATGREFHDDGTRGGLWSLYRGQVFIVDEFISESDEVVFHSATQHYNHKYTMSSNGFLKNLTRFDKKDKIMKTLLLMVKESQDDDDVWEVELIKRAIKDLRADHRAWPELKVIEKSIK